MNQDSTPISAANLFWDSAKNDYKVVGTPEGRKSITPVLHWKDPALELSEHSGKMTSELHAAS